VTWLAALARPAAPPPPGPGGNVLMHVRYLGPGEGRLTGVREPYGPDAIVFGPSYVTGDGRVAAREQCEDCGTGWGGDGGCWAPGHGRANGG
jgi:hypothetical protein